MDTMFRCSVSRKPISGLMTLENVFRFPFHKIPFSSLVSGKDLLKVFCLQNTFFSFWVLCLWETFSRFYVSRRIFPVSRSIEDFFRSFIYKRLRLEALCLQKTLFRYSVHSHIRTFVYKIPLS